MAGLMNRTALFLIACVLGGLGGALGSMVGHSFGKAGLWMGGIIGGLLASMLIARIALWRRWIVRSQYWPTVLGAAVGFLLACSVAVNTLSSPIGPILSTLLIGVGAVLGSMREPSAADPHDHPA
jgi:fructose-specific phosphotransferase system IIC component